MSTTVPYWSNMHTLIVALSSVAPATGLSAARVRVSPRHDAAVLRDEAVPGGGGRALGGVDERGGVDMGEPVVVDDDAAVHENRLHVLRVGVVDQVLDRVEGRREAERPVVEDNQVRALV